MQLRNQRLAHVNKNKTRKPFKKILQNISKNWIFSKFQTITGWKLSQPYTRACIKKSSTLYSDFSIKKPNKVILESMSNETTENTISTNNFERISLQNQRTHLPNYQPAMNVKQVVNFFRNLNMQRIYRNIIIIKEFEMKRNKNRSLKN